MGTFVSKLAGNSAATLVRDGVDLANQRATTALRNANTNLRQLSEFEFFNSASVTVNLPDIDVTGVDAQFPDAPEAPALDLVLPAFPTDIVFNTIPTLETGQVPELDSVAPTLLFPASPVPFAGTAPSSPTIDTDLVYPDAPTQVLPSVPSLIDLDIPVAPIIALPLFTEPLPTQSVVIPGLTFNWSEDPYTSAGLTAVQDSLLERIQGGSGFDSTVEQQIWDRSRTRETEGQLRSRQELLSNNAQLGFSRPTGSAQAGLDFLAQQTQNQINSLSRDIAIKQAELEQANFQTSIQAIISLEQLLIKDANDVQNRAFESEKFTQELMFNIYNAEIGKFNAELESYKAFTNSFDILVKAELQKLQVYVTELEGQKLIGQLNEQNIAIYSATLDGLKTEIDLYRGQVDAINARLQGENLKLSAFKTEIDGFSALIKAKESEISSYDTSVKAEATKMDAYTSEVRAFTARVEAYSQGILADKQKTDVAVQTEQLRLSQHALKLDVYSKTVDAKVSAFQAQATEFQSQSNAYATEVRTEGSRLDYESKRIDQSITFAKATTDVALQNARINIANIESSTNSLLEATKASAQVSANLAASSMAGISFGGSVSHGLSLGNSLSESHPFAAQ